MEMGKKAYAIVKYRMLLLILMTGAALCGPTLGMAGDYASKSAQGSGKSRPLGLRDAGNENFSLLTQEIIFRVDPRAEPFLRAPINVVIHFVSAALQTRDVKRNTSAIKPYTHGENQKHWYAIAGAGSHAVALKSGAPIEADGLRLQRRAKIGIAQLGMARDIGAGRMTLGYLRSANEREALLSFSRPQKKQDMAALTLTIKR